jgi:TolB-like protein/Tfp pilus assembly protein PilF
MRSVGDKAFRFESYTLDLSRGCLYGADREIELRPKSFDVLSYLVENAGRLVSKDEILKAVWRTVTVSDESVTRCISDVRLALGDSEQHIIKTVQRRGYRFAAAVAPATARGPGAPAAFGRASARPPTQAVGGTDAPAAPRLSLVVLPFANLSMDAAQDYLADVITEGLTTYLFRIPGSFVIARTMAARYRGEARDVRQIAKELGVRYVLEGSVQHAGTRVRVTAQLIDAETAAHLWADQFDADQANVLRMQDTIVTRLARALQIELAAAEAAHISRTRPASANAEDLALKAEAIFLRYGAHRDEAETAYTLCERALRKDPGNVRALSILAEKFSSRLNALQSTDRKTDTQRAERLVSRALAIDPNSYHAHHAKAQVLVAQKRAEEALVEAERSLRLNPSFIPTYRDLCHASLLLAQPERVIEYAEQAMRLSPPDPYLYVFYAHKGYGLFMLRSDQDAIACLRRAVANNPGHPLPSAWLAATLALTGGQAEAREALNRYLSLRGAKTRTITQFRSLMNSDNPAYLAFRERFHDGLRSAGMAED